MKKLLLLFTTLIIFFPLHLNASDITAKLAGPKEVTIGETLTIKYTINVPNVGQTEDNIKGIVGIYYDINYDQNLLSLRNVTASNYETTFAKKEGEMFVESEPKIKDCLEETTYCGSGTYTATFTFDILSKETKPASIKITDPIIAVIDAKDISEDVYKGLTLEEILEKAFKESPNNFETLIVTLKKPKEQDTRSTNTNLKLLEIQNYKIDFNKDTKEYEINVAKEVKKIVVKAETEDSKSRIIMTGDDDLSSNGNKVTIEVVAEDDSRTTYTINVIHKEDLTNVVEEDKEEKQTTKITSDKKILKLFGIISGVLAILITIFVVKGIIKKRSINKMFEEL